MTIATELRLSNAARDIVLIMIYLIYHRTLFQCRKAEFTKFRIVRRLVKRAPVFGPSYLVKPLAVCLTAWVRTRRRVTQNRIWIAVNGFIRV